MYDGWSSLSGWRLHRIWLFIQLNMIMVRKNILLLNRDHFVVEKTELIEILIKSLVKDTENRGNQREIDKKKEETRERMSLGIIRITNRIRFF